MVQSGLGRRPARAARWHCGARSETGPSGKVALWGSVGDRPKL